MSPSLRSAALALAISLLALGVPADLHAQARRDTARAAAQRPQRPMPDTTAAHTDFHLQAQMDSMGPMMAQMAHAMMQAQLGVLARRETADQMATFAKNYFDALVAKGFTREEAMRIVLAHGIPNPRWGQ